MAALQEYDARRRDSVLGIAFQPSRAAYEQREPPNHILLPSLTITASQPRDSEWLLSTRPPIHRMDTE